MSIVERWATRHHNAPTLSLQALDAGDDRSRIDDEELRGPRHDGCDRSLACVARTVREPNLAGVSGARFTLGLRGDAVDTRTARIVDGHVRIDGFVTDPATPLIVRSYLVEPTHDWR